jgi:hypothetical protein
VLVPHVVPGAHELHATPPLPHAPSSVPAAHVLSFLQQPVHEVASQTHAPLTQRWPVPQLPVVQTPPQPSLAPQAFAAQLAAHGPAPHVLGAPPPPHVKPTGQPPQSTSAAQSKTCPHLPAQAAGFGTHASALPLSGATSLTAAPSSARPSTPAAASPASLPSRTSRPSPSTSPQPAIGHRAITTSTTRQAHGKPIAFDLLLTKGLQSKARTQPTVLRAARAEAIRRRFATSRRDRAQRVPSVASHS